MDLQNPTPEDLLCDESFLRYCRGEDQHWINEHPGSMDVADRAKRLYDILSAGKGSSSAQLSALKDAITRREEFTTLIRNRPTPVRINKIRILSYAATVALLIIGAAVIYNKKLPKHEYATAQNIRQTIMLPDSSVVMLNGDSHLSISKNRREVTLIGEAFFDIKHDAAHPFIVHTKDYNIRVLGTSFNVNTKRAETDLISGKVEIVPVTHAKVILRPNQKYVLKQNITNLQIDTLTNHAIETSWARTKIDVHNETLEEIAQKLETWYGIRIIFANEQVKKYRYTASFNDGTIFNILQYLKQSYPFTYRVEQDTIIISES